MLSGIVGDVIGSIYEAHQWQKKELPLIQLSPFNQEDVVSLFRHAKWVRQEPSWTDDTLCTLALYDAYIHQRNPRDALVYWCKKYQEESIGFGKKFEDWLDNPVPYGSFANGAVMRIGFIPYLNLSLGEKIQLAIEYTSVSHNHVDAYQAVTDFIVCSHLLKEEKDNHKITKKSLKNTLLKYNFSKTVEEMHQERKFEMNALQTLLQACVVVYESNNMEDILRNSFYVGGDSDTLACIAANLGSMIYECPRDLLYIAEKSLHPFDDLYSLYQHFVKNY